MNGLLSSNENVFVTFLLPLIHLCERRNKDVKITMKFICKWSHAHNEEQVEDKKIIK